MKATIQKLLPLMSITLLVACVDMEGKAKEEFARKYVCPDDRTTIKTRKDINGYDLMWGPYEYKEPPAEIKADPGRLAVWNSQQEEEKNQHNRSGYTVVEAEGCSVKVFYACTTSNQGRAMCSEKEYKEQVLPDKAPK